MSLLNSVREILSGNLNLDYETTHDLSIEIVRLIEASEGLDNLPESFIQSKLGSASSVIQLMLANDHSSIQHAAQNVVQIFFDDHRSIIPDNFRSAFDCPYPGLSSFTSAERNYYFGRKTEVESFVERVNRPVIALTGPSGIGKSSFIAAGVLPKLIEQTENTIFLNFVVYAGSMLLSSLADHLSQYVTTQSDTIEHNLRRHDDALLKILQQSNPQGRCVLFIDQFEALFVGVEENVKAERHCLIRNLLTIAAATQQSAVTVILASRENYFEHPDYLYFPDLASLVQHQNMRLAPLRQSQLRMIIEQPLHYFNQVHDLSIEFQEGLVELIIDDFKNLNVSLPLVQYLLRLMWIEKQRLTHIAFNSLGKLESVLNSHAIKIFQSFSDDEKPLVKALLVSLVKPGLDGEYSRKRIRRSTLIANTHSSEDRLVHIIAQLSSNHSRILSEQQVGSISYIELTHDILISQWALLQNVIEGQEKRIRLRERLLPKAEAWWNEQIEAKNKPHADDLYIGNELAKAQEYVNDSQFTPEIDGIIQACLSASLQNRRRQFIFRSVVFVFTAVLLIGAILWQRQGTIREQQRANANATLQAIAESERAAAEAETALSKTREAQAAEAEIEAQRLRTEFQAEQLAQASKASLATDSEIALLLAVAGVKISEQPNTWLQLSNSLSPSSDLLKLDQSMEGNNFVIISSLTFSPDNSLALISGCLTASSRFNLCEAVVELWNIETEELLFSKEYDTWINSAVFSKDGTKILLASSDNSAFIWDQSGDRLVTLEGHTGEVREAKFSPDEQTILTVSSDSTARLWDMTGTQRAVFLGHENVIWSGAFSPDGQSILTASFDKTARLWSLEGEEISIFIGHEDRINGSLGIHVLTLGMVEGDVRL